MRKIALATGLVCLTFISLNFALPKKENNLVGTYKSQQYGLFRRGYAFLTSQVHFFAKGSEIKLNSDSTFLRTTCGNIITGKWRASKDTLYLNIFTNKFRIDSLNRTGINGHFPVTGGTLKFKISETELSRMYKVILNSDSTKKTRGLETLVKVEVR